jgi:hypothetical protein
MCPLRFPVRSYKEDRKQQTKPRIDTGQQAWFYSEPGNTHPAKFELRGLKEEDVT